MELSTVSTKMVRSSKSEMGTEMKLVRIQGEGGAAHLRESLGDGGQLARLLDHEVSRRSGVLSVFLPTADDVIDDYSSGRGVSKAQTEVALIELLREGVGVRDLYLYVEDELRRVGDRANRSLPEKSYLVVGGDRLLHWMQINSQTLSDVPLVIRRGSGGYPLNACIAQLGPPKNAAEADPGFLARVAASADYVIVSALDGESFLVWEPEG
jgi:hypothetical protein